MKKLLLFSVLVFVFSSFASAVINDSSIYYSFDNGDLVTDLSGNGHDGVNNGATTGVSGVLNEQFSYDGVNDYVNTTFNSESLGTGYRSVCFWITHGTSTRRETIINKFHDGDEALIHDGWRVDIKDTGVIQAGGHDNSDSTNYYLVDSTVSVDDGNPHFVCALISTSNVDIYIDNVEVSGSPASSGARNNFDNSLDLTIGMDWSPSSNNFTGSIDEFSYYPRQLSTGEMDLLWNSGLGFNPYGSNATNFSVVVVSDYSGNPINNVSVTLDNGSVYTNITGSVVQLPILSNSTSLWNFTINATNWFSKRYEDVNVSTNLQAELIQSQINITPLELITNDSISNFSIKIGSEVVCNVTGSSCVFYPDAGSYNLTLIDNTGQETYHTTSNEISVAALENSTKVIFGHGHEILVYARTIIGNTTINNFTATLSSLNITDVRELTTTDGEINFDAIHNTYNITIDAPGYSTFNNSQLVTVDSSQLNFTVTFYLYTTNSIDFIFRDAQTLQILNETNTSLEIISDLQSNNYTTSNGTLYIDLLSPGLFTLRFNSNNYTERFYYLQVVDRSYNQLTLYLLKESEATDITINLVDDNDNTLSDAYLKVLRYDVTTNTYLLQEIFKTDVEGKAYIEAELGSEFYKFIVDYPFGTTVYSSSPQYIESESFILPVLLNPIYAAFFFNSLGVSGDIVYNDDTGNWRFDYSDSYNGISGACLYIYSVSLSSKTLINSSCADTSSGTILIAMTPVDGVSYSGVGTILYDTREYYFSEGYFRLPGIDDEDSKNYRLSIVLFLTLAILLLFAWNPTLMFLFMPLPLLVTSLIGFVEFDKTVSIGFMVLGLILAYWTNNKR